AKVKDLDGFAHKVREVSGMLAIPPEWLMAVMYAESSFNPSALNHKGSGATGLIQFMPATAAELGISLDRLRRMDAVQQLEYVYLYLQKVRERYGDYQHLTDLYLAILFPRARGQDYCFTLYATPSQSYKQNSGLDEDQDGRVTVSDVDRHLKRMYPQAYITQLVSKT
ncbi:MAG: lytic transglycosylase domain-containing protein, partial [Bacteroidota bacterium]